MIVETTLENWKNNGRGVFRRDGNTTRLIDHAVQLLYEGKTVVLLDHHQSGYHEDANNNFAERLFRRLQNEHGIKKRDISINDAEPIPFKHYDGKIEMVKYPAQQAILQLKIL